MTVGLAILAAGCSQRMAGEHKLARNLAGKPLIHYAFDLCQATGLAKPVIVLGGRLDEVKAALPGDGAGKIFVNPLFSEGMASSVATAVRVLKDHHKAVLLLMADMPLINPETLKSLLAALPDNDQASIIIPTFEGQRGNPVIWTYHFFELLTKLKGDKGGRQLFARFRDAIIEVTVDDQGVLFDVDTQTDFAQAELALTLKGL